MIDRKRLDDLRSVLAIHRAGCLERKALDKNSPLFEYEYVAVSEKITKAIVDCTFLLGPNFDFLRDLVEELDQLSDTDPFE